MNGSVVIATNTGYHAMSAEDMNTKNRIVFINEEINDESAHKIVNQLLYLDSISDEPITIFVSTPGGSVQSGLYIYDIMKSLRSVVRTIAAGMAASMGSIIFSSGTKGERYMLPSAMVMIHEPLISEARSINVSSVLKLGEKMTVTKTRLNKILSENSGKPIEVIDEDTKEDKYLTAEEAIEYGLADKIYTGGILY